MNTTRVKGIIGVCIVFLCGAAAGAMITHALGKRQMAALLEEGPAGFQKVVSRHLAAELSLDDAQRDELKAILDRHHQGVMQIMGPLHPRMEQQFERTADRIRTILDPEQLERFNSLAERQKRRLAKPFLDAEQAPSTKPSP